MQKEVNEQALYERVMLVNWWQLSTQWLQTNHKPEFSEKISFFQYLTTLT